MAKKPLGVVRGMKEVVVVVFPSDFFFGLALSLRCGAGVRWAKPDLAWEFGRDATWERPEGLGLRS
jgi:hypothetical protein